MIKDVGYPLRSVNPWVVFLRKPDQR